MNNIKKSIFKTYIEDEVPPPLFRAWHFSSPGRNSSSLACANTSFSNTWYMEFSGGTLPVLGGIVYLNSNLTSPVSGGELWYNLQEAFIDEPRSYQIGNDGSLMNSQAC